MTNRRWIAIGVAIVGLVIVCGAVAVLVNAVGRLSGTPTVPQIAEPEIAQNDDEPDLPLTGENVFIGQLVAARSVDVDDCPIDPLLTFGIDDDIHIVAVNTNLPSGTEIGVRVVSQADSEQVVDVSPELTADEDYVDACLSFTVQTEDLVEGTYIAEVVTDGTIQETISFTIQ